MHHLKELAFTFIMMLIFSGCTVSFNNPIIYGTLHTTGLFSCYRSIILFESEYFKTGIFKTKKNKCKNGDRFLSIQYL